MTPTRNAARRGTALKAVSWMLVTICSRLTRTPATRPIASSGALSQKVAMRVSRTIWTTESGVIASVEALDEGSDEQIPSIDEHEEQDLERRGEHHGRQLDHADREGHRGDDDVDHEERKEEHGADLEAGLELGNDVGRDQDLEVEVVRRARGGRMRYFEKELDIFFAGVFDQERLQRLRALLDGLLLGDRAFLHRDPVGRSDFV